MIISLIQFQPTLEHTHASSRSSGGSTNEEVERNDNARGRRLGVYLEGLGSPAGLWIAHQGALAVSLAAPSRSPSCFWERHSRPGLKQHTLTGHKRRSKSNIQLKFSNFNYNSQWLLF